MTDSDFTSQKNTERLAIRIAIRVGLPMAGAMFVLAELGNGLTVSEMWFPALLLAAVLIFVSFNQAIGIADDRLNDDLPEDCYRI